MRTTKELREMFDEMRTHSPAILTGPWKRMVDAILVELLERELAREQNMLARRPRNVGYVEAPDGETA